MNCVQNNNKSFGGLQCSKQFFDSSTTNTQAFAQIGKPREIADPKRRQATIEILRMIIGRIDRYLAVAADLYESLTRSNMYATNRQLTYRLAINSIIEAATILREAADVITTAVELDHIGPPVESSDFDDNPISVLSNIGRAMIDLRHRLSQHIAQNKFELPQEYIVRIDTFSNALGKTIVYFEKKSTTDDDFYARAAAAAAASVSPSPPAFSRVPMTPKVDVPTSALSHRPSISWDPVERVRMPTSSDRAYLVPSMSVYVNARFQHAEEISVGYIALSLDMVRNAAADETLAVLHGNRIRRQVSVIKPRWSNSRLLELATNAGKLSAINYDVLHGEYASLARGYSRPMIATDRYGDVDAGQLVAESYLLELYPVALASVYGGVEPTEQLLYRKLRGGVITYMTSSPRDGNLVLLMTIKGGLDRSLVVCNWLGEPIANTVAITPGTGSRRAVAACVVPSTGEIAVLLQVDPNATTKKPTAKDPFMPSFLQNQAKVAVTALPALLRYYTSDGNVRYEYTLPPSSQTWGPVRRMIIDDREQILILHGNETFVLLESDCVPLLGAAPAFKIILGKLMLTHINDFAISESGYLFVAHDGGVARVFQAPRSSSGNDA